MTALRIGTRGSPLALWQARTVAAAVGRAGGPACELVVIKTTGDKLTTSLAEVGGKRLFVKEIEDALLDGSVDVAVHSAKDLPAELPEGLVIQAALTREDPRDALVVADARQEGCEGTAASLMAALGPSPTVGTGSVRRIAQLSRRFAHSVFAPIRGNVETRLRKLDAGRYDGLVLAAAGLTRLGLSDRISACFSFEECVPAPGQGIVAVEARADDTDTAAALAPIADPDAMAALDAERALVQALGGGCQVPIGAIATLDADGLALRAVVASLDGSRILQRSDRGSTDAAGNVGRRVAAALLHDGADEILALHQS